MISAKILADSIAPSGKRLITFECTYPRAIHSEIMTHRMLSKNSASSRAIPTAKLIQRIVDDPWIPSYIGANQKGMQAGEALSAEERVVAERIWLEAREAAVGYARELLGRGIHKQVINRLLEPWMHITVIISATERENFYALRRHEMAEPHFHELADKMWEAEEASQPRVLSVGEWHLPLVHFDDEIDRALSLTDLIKVSVGRCARVSYLTHDGRRDPKEDIVLHDRLLLQRPLHASPAEHVAQALAEPTPSGNFVGWQQYRKTLAFENVPG
jgi:thymidylate synthase ThyX